jgi:hypothetical protein
LAWLEFLVRIRQKQIQGELLEHSKYQNKISLQSFLD